MPSNLGEKCLLTVTGYETEMKQRKYTNLDICTGERPQLTKIWDVGKDSLPERQHKFPVREDLGQS